VDTQLARRQGWAGLRWRRACLAGTTVVAAATAVVVALAVGPASGPVAPRQFSPLVPYVSFGWLPGRRCCRQHSPDGDESDRGAQARRSVHMGAHRLRGRAAPPHRHGQESDLLHRGFRRPHREDQRLRPAVHGHRAFWAGPYLVWRYARGGWAWLIRPLMYGSPRRDTAKLDALKHDAVKVADHVLRCRHAAGIPRSADPPGRPVAGEQHVLPAGRRGAASQPVCADHGYPRSWRRRRPGIPEQHSLPQTSTPPRRAAPPAERELPRSSTATG
jgi:hypothetical protein